MVKANVYAVDIRGYRQTICREFAQIAHAMILKNVAAPEELKEFIDTAAKVVKESSTEVIDSSEKIEDLESRIKEIAKEFVAELLQLDSEEGTDNK